MPNKTIEIFERMPDGTDRSVRIGPENSHEINKALSQIAIFSAKHKDNRFSCRISEQKDL